MWVGLRYIGSEELLAVEWFESAREMLVENFVTFPVKHRCDLFEVVEVEIKIGQVI